MKFILLFLLTLLFVELFTESVGRYTALYLQIAGMLEKDEV